MITSDTLIASGADLTEVLSVLEELAGTARRVTALAVTASHEIALGDLRNLKRALTAAEGRHDIDALWPVFIFAKRLCADNEFPDLGGGPNRVRFAVEGPARRSLRSWRVAQRQRRAFDDLRRGVAATIAALDRLPLS